MIFHTARKYRIYPTTEQIKIIEQTFGVCRYVWNKMVEAINHQQETANTLTIPSYRSIADDSVWLNDRSIKMDRHSVQNVHNDMNHALTDFFKYINNVKKGSAKLLFRKDGKPKHFPRFKSKKYNKQSFTSHDHVYLLYIDFVNSTIKLNRLGFIRFDNRSKPIPENWIMKEYTVSRKSGKYYCSIRFEYEDDRLHRGLNCIQLDESKYIGLDYKSDGLYIDSNGQCAEYPKYYRQSQKRLRMLQKKYSRQQKGSRNHEKTRLKIQQLHDHISNQRKDFLHKLSTAITKQYDVICVEDLNMIAMSQCLRLGKSTMDNGFGMFRLMLTYKALRQPMKFVIKVGRFYPSSKTCSYCGYKLDALKLSDRVFNCPKCKHSIDRDFNAAINIRNEGYRIIREEMYGYYTI